MARLSPDKELLAEELMRDAVQQLEESKALSFHQRGFLDIPHLLQRVGELSDDGITVSGEGFEEVVELLAGTRRMLDALISRSDASSTTS